MSEHNKIVAKIQKLLAMADESNNATEQERETAMRQATKLMDKYAITMSDVDGPDSDDDPRDETQLELGSLKWKAMVVDAIGTLFGCKVYRMRGRRGRPAKIVIVGRESARITVAAMATYVIHSIHRESKRLPGDRTMRSSFKVGAACGVWAQVRTLIEERRKGETTSIGTAMVVVNAYASELDANNRWLEEQGVKLGSSSGPRVRSNSGYSAGHAYGKSVSLNRQVQGGSSAPAGLLK